MKKATLSIVCFIICFCTIKTAVKSNAQSAQSGDGAVVERTTYKFPTYEEALKNTDLEKYSSKAVYEQAVGDRRFEFQKVKYLSDGLKVTAYLYRARQPQAHKLPAIIFNRGSFVRKDIAPELIAFFHRLAQEGFAVIAPLYRQSDGGEGRDEMGGADLHDLMNVARLARGLDFVDANNLFMYGESRGGMMTYQAVRDGFPLKAAAVFGAFTDLEGFLAANANSLAMARQIWSAYDERKEEIIARRSAIRWIEKLNTPLLIMHGGADPLVSPLQSLALAEKLQQAGKVYELVVYAEDNHILSKNSLDRDRRALAWFKQHLSR